MAVTSWKANSAWMFKTNNVVSSRFFKMSSETDQDFSVSFGETPSIIILLNIYDFLICQIYM